MHEAGRWREQLEALEQLRAKFVRLQSLRHRVGWRAARIWDLAKATRRTAANLAFEEHVDGGDHHDVEALLGVRGAQDRRFWRVKWKGISKKILKNGKVRKFLTKIRVEERD